MILIPARDEGPRVARVVQGARAACPGVPVVVVASGCTDDTAARAREAGAEVVDAPRGYANALVSGYREAVRRWDARVEGPRWVVQLDADGQHPADRIPDLVARLAEAEVVVGSRFAAEVAPKAASSTPAARRIAIRALSLWTSALVGQRVRDVTSGFQALAEPVVRQLAQDFPAEVADANVLVRLVRHGHRLVEVPVAMAPREGGQSMHGGLYSVGYVARLVGLTLREAVRPG